MIPVENRMGTGIRGLDVMLGGGLIPGRPYLISGNTGSGKTLLGMQFLLEGIRVGEKVLLVAVDEPPSEILDNVRSLKWDLAKIHTLDATPGLQVFRRLGDLQEIRALHEVKSMEEMGDKPNRAQSGEDVTLQAIYLKLKKQMEILPFKRVLIDSLTSIRYFALRSGTDVQTERVEIQSLMRFLSEKGATTILTAQPIDATELSAESLLCRGEIELSRGWEGNVMERWIWVRRMRGTYHDNQKRPLEIGSDGLSVKGVDIP